MYVKQVKRKCSVRGCKNTECFAISRTREVGNTVIICKSCLGKALGAIDEIDPKTKSNIPALDNTSAPSLFFNAKALGTDAAETKVDDVPSVTPDNGQENTTPPADDSDKAPEQTGGVDPADDTSGADVVTPPANTVPLAPDAENGASDDVMPPADVTEFKCPICGRAFDSEKGLNTHLRYCKPQTDGE